MEQEVKKEKRLEYHVSEKATFAVVTFSGEMSKANLEVVQTCETELVNSGAVNFVLDLSNVALITWQAIPAFVHLQKVVRDKGQLRLCAIDVDTKRFLLDKAAIRESEYSEDLAHALKSLADSVEKT